MGVTTIQIFVKKEQIIMYPTRGIPREVLVTLFDVFSFYGK